MSGQDSTLLVEPLSLRLHGFDMVIPKPSSSQNPGAPAVGPSRAGRARGESRPSPRRGGGGERGAQLTRRGGGEERGAQLTRRARPGRGSAAGTRADRSAGGRERSVPVTFGQRARAQPEHLLRLLVDECVR